MFEEFTTWLTKHWPEMAAYLGIGAGGSLGAIKIKDKQKDEAIKEIQQVLKTNHGKITATEVAVELIKQEIKTNAKFDEQLRKQMEQNYVDLKENMKDLSSDFKEVRAYILNKGG